MISKISEDLPSWLNEAISLIKGKNENENSRKVTAETVNVNSLDKVEHNGETYYVKMKEDDAHNGALLYNKFGTFVEEIYDVTNPQQVQDYLDKNNVVVNHEIPDDTDKTEVVSIMGNNKATSASINNGSNIRYANDDEEIELLEDTDDSEEFHFENDFNFENEITRIAEDLNTNVSNDTTTDVPVNNAPQTVNTNSAPVSSVPSFTDNTVPSGMTISQGSASQTITTQASNCFVSKKKYNQVVARVNKLERTLKKLAAFIQAEHAYSTEPLNLDLNSADLEYEHYVDMENATRVVIDAEHKLDMSTARDRAIMNEHFLKNVENNQVQEPNVGINNANNFYITEEEVNDLAKPSVEHTKVVPVAEEIINNGENNNETINNGDTVNEEIANETISNEPKTNIIPLENEDDITRIKTKICPCCLSENSLETVDEVESWTGVRCNKCETEFAYDNNANKLFQKIMIED